MVSYATDAVSAGAANDSLVLLVDNTATPYTFLAVGLIHDQPITSAPSGLTLRDTASAGGYTWSFYTGPLVPSSTFLFDFFVFAADVHATMVWLAFEADGGGAIYDGLSVHGVDMAAASGSVAAETYPSVEGWPFVWAWSTGPGATDTSDVTYFDPLRAQNDRDNEWLVLHGPDDCAGFPTHWPYDFALTGDTFRRLSMVDLAAPSNSRPFGCTIPDPPAVSAHWRIGRIGWPT